MNRTITWLSVVVLVLGLAVVGGISLRARAGSQGLVSIAYAADRPAHRADHGCSNHTLKGTYGLSFSGLTGGTGEAKPVAVVGLLTFDGKGGATGAVTVNFNGTILRLEPDGAYAVNSDCTGSITLNAGPVPLFQADGVIVNGGAEMQFISTIPELVSSGVAKKL